MKFHLLLVAALLVAAGSGCFGLPAGSADTGDAVSVRYTVTDLATGAVLRSDRTASFVLGSGESGLGLGFERALRGQGAGGNLTFEVHGDATLDYANVVQVDRALAPIPSHQLVPRDEFDATPFGPATVGKRFDAYGIYVGNVTAVNETEVAFTVSTMQEPQENVVSSVGAVLVTSTTATHLLRTLDPTVGAAFAIQPPSPFNPSTPLGLKPGSYKTTGATETKLQYLHSPSLATDLLGKELGFTVAILSVTAGSSGPEPVDGNYGVRQSPQVDGDPASVLDGALLPEASDGHTH